MSVLGSVWNCLLDACIIIGGVGGVVSLYSCRPKLQVSSRAYINDSYSAVCVRVRSINKYVVIKSVKISGHKIAEQGRDIKGKTFDEYQLHCVLSPSEDKFVESLPVDIELYPLGDPEPIIFVIRETDLSNLEITFQIESWFLPIRYKLTV